ncbi:MAG: hypothetical protein PHD87_08805 [Candidatus Cloacimonetes bacterium]|nr:hypothetical protein [Candidatus Cloacimonadota bacterium]
MEIKLFRNFSIIGEFDGKDFNAGLKYSYQNIEARYGVEAVGDLLKATATKTTCGLPWDFPKR